MMGLGRGERVANQIACQLVECARPNVLDADCGGGPITGAASPKSEACPKAGKEAHTKGETVVMVEADWTGAHKKGRLREGAASCTILNEYLSSWQGARRTRCSGSLPFFGGGARRKGNHMCPGAWEEAPWEKRRGVGVWCMCYLFGGELLVLQPAQPLYARANASTYVSFLLRSSRWKNGGSGGGAGGAWGAWLLRVRAAFSWCLYDHCVYDGHIYLMMGSFSPPPHAWAT